MNLCVRIWGLNGVYLIELHASHTHTHTHLSPQGLPSLPFLPSQGPPCLPSELRLRRGSSEVVKDSERERGMCYVL